MKDGTVSNAAELNLTEDEATAIKNAAGAARTRFAAANIAKNAAKSATLTQSIAVSDMKSLLSSAIKKIRLYAETTNNPGVYALADIPAPAAPTPAPNPVQPSNIGVSIVPGGALKIIFKAVNPGNGGPVSYLVSRRLMGETAFTQIGSTGTSRRPGEGLPRGFKSFTDSTLPAGANNFQYQIIGQRGDTFGEPSEVFTVIIGGVGDGSMNQATLRMAA